MQITERRRDRNRRHDDHDLRDRLNTLSRQMRRLRERNADAFDQGYNACLRRAEAGADLEQLRAGARHSAGEWVDTSPFEIVELVAFPDEVTQVDGVPLAEVPR